MKKKINTLSASALNLFLTYPDAYYYKYVLGIKEQTKSEKLILGTLIHRGIERILEGKEYVKDAWRQAKKEAFGLEAAELESVYDEVLRLLNMYEKDGPYFEPDTIEKLVKVKLIHPSSGKETTFPWVAKIDLITKNNWVVDHKTTSSEMKKLQSTYKNQAIGYWMTVKALTGKRPEYFVLNQIIKQKRKPRCRVDFYEFTEDEEAQFFDLVETVTHKILNEDFWGAPFLKTYYPHPYPELKMK